MASGPTVLLLCAGVTLLLGRVLGDNELNLEDALSDDTTLRPTPEKPRNPSGGAGTGNFNIEDMLDFNTPTDKQTTKPPKRVTTTKAPKKGGGDGDIGQSDFLQTTKSPHKTTKAPNTTKKTPKKGTSDPSLDFDLADALDDSNDNGKGGKGDSDHPRHPRPKGNNPGSSTFSNQELENVLKNSDYSPDKKKSDGPSSPSNDEDQVALPETTIAGIASAVAAALLGAVSSYIAYQKKKLCFKMQGSLNQPYVKGESAEAGTMSEPQGTVCKTSFSLSRYA
ncbi:CD99 antigen-like protein 2 isoform X2 [Hypanus sabinus]|uniref:CD99 antigen-like protein 2 isoform X2 n=1 Tax=Hypanus sabinus TaxID=79690 RepID=UPI0028C4F78E|nr:CD99 antigen-like protein 2 isoform X2 [Hypanus sabinus]